MLQALKDPSWAGVAGVAAIATLILAWMDRQTDRDPKPLDQFFKLLLFALAGASYGCLGIVVFGFAGDILHFFRIERIQGEFGERLSDLGQIRLGYWAFNKEIPEISRQCSALGLWGGSIAGSCLVAMEGIENGFKSMRRIHVYMGLCALIGIVATGLINFGLSLH